MEECDIPFFDNTFIDEPMPVNRLEVKRIEKTLAKIHSDEENEEMVDYVKILNFVKV
jgi:hypothetical protein